MESNFPDVTVLLPPFPHPHFASFTLIVVKPPQFGVGKVSSREAVLPLMYCVREDGLQMGQHQPLRFHERGVPSVCVLSHLEKVQRLPVGVQAVLLSVSISYINLAKGKRENVLGLPMVP